MNYPNELVEAVKAVADAINGEGGGGGSENYIEEYNGTIGMLINGGGNKPYEILNGILSGDISAKVTIPTAEGEASFDLIAHDDGFLVSDISYNSTSETLFGNLMRFVIDGEIDNYDIRLAYYVYVREGSITDQTTLAENVPAVLTVYYHPMPKE